MSTSFQYFWSKLCTWPQRGYFYFYSPRILLFGGESVTVPTRIHKFHWEGSDEGKKRQKNEKKEKISHFWSSSYSNKGWHSVYWGGLWRFGSGDTDEVVRLKMRVRPISKGMPWQHKGVEWIPKTDRCITIADIRYFKKTALFCDFWACLSFCNQWIFGSGRGVTCAACVLACIHLQSHFKHHILKKVALF